MSGEALPSARRRAPSSARRPSVLVALLAPALAAGAATAQTFPGLGSNNVVVGCTLEGYDQNTCTTTPSSGCSDAAALGQAGRAHFRADDVGMQFNRWVLYWYYLADCIDCATQAEPANWNWAKYEDLVSRDRDNGLHSLVVFQGVPECLRIAPNKQVPIGLDTPMFRRPNGDATDRPGQAAAGVAGINPANPWAQFVFHAVDRLGDRVKYWEVWNEPNAYCPDNPERPGCYWAGTMPDYMRLIEVTSLAAKHARADAQVVLGGLVDDDAYAGRNDSLALLNALKGNSPKTGRLYRNYLDVYNLHSYQSPWAAFEFTRWMRAQGFRNRPYWLTETGVVDAAPIKTACGGLCTGAEADFRASYVLQLNGYYRSASGRARNLQQLFQYGFQPELMSGAPLGDAEEQSTYKAYRLLHTFLPEPVQPLTRRFAPDPSARVDWQGREQRGWQALRFGTSVYERTTLLWAVATQNQVAQVQALDPTRRAQVVRQDSPAWTQDGQGRWYDAATSFVSAVNSRYLVDLPARDASQGLVAGKTAFLVEDDAVLETLRVPSDDRLYRSNTEFAPGTYRVDVSGTYQWGGCDPGFCSGGNACGYNRWGDADFMTDDCWGSTFPDWGGWNIALQVNGAAVAWGPFDPGHAYATTVTLTTQQPITFRLFDCPTCYGDNTGSLVVRISQP
jgi:hypothetical protein